MPISVEFGHFLKQLRPNTPPSFLTVHSRHFLNKQIYFPTISRRRKYKKDWADLFCKIKMNIVLFNFKLGMVL